MSDKLRSGPWETPHSAERTGLNAMIATAEWVLPWGQEVPEQLLDVAACPGAPRSTGALPSPASITLLLKSKTHCAMRPSTCCSALMAWRHGATGCVLEPYCRGLRASCGRCGLITLLAARRGKQRREDDAATNNGGRVRYISNTERGARRGPATSRRTGAP